MREVPGTGPPMCLIYPGALLPALQVRDVGPAGAAAITAAIRDVHLDSPAPSDTPVGGVVLTKITPDKLRNVELPGP